MRVASAHAQAWNAHVVEYYRFRAFEGGRDPLLVDDRLRILAVGWEQQASHISLRVVALLYTLQSDRKGIHKVLQARPHALQQFGVHRAPFGNSSQTSLHRLLFCVESIPR